MIGSRKINSVIRFCSVIDRWLAVILSVEVSLQLSHKIFTLITQFYLNYFENSSVTSKAPLHVKIAIFVMPHASSTREKSIVSFLVI